MADHNFDMGRSDELRPSERPLDAPDRTEVREEGSGAVLGTYDPRTQPIDELMDLVFHACVEERKPDWNRFPSCPIPEDLRRHVYAVDFRGWAWAGDELEFPNGVSIEQLRAHLATIEPERQFPRLPLDEAVALDDQTLRERFNDAALEASGYDSIDEMPSDFPWHPASLSREQILEIVRVDAHWFDPDRGHPFHFSNSVPSAPAGEPRSSITGSAPAPG
jgi:hypothetical protein